jgi:hypothetical protein
MAAKLTFRYDRIGDILYIDKCLPYKEQEEDQIGDQLAVRTNPKTGDIETVEIMFFKKKLDGDDSFELPLTGKLEIVGQPEA